MSVCDTCRTKGNCCDGFVLNLWFSKDNWFNESIKKLQEHKLDYMYPIRPCDYFGKDTVQVQFGCNNLGDDGLCKDYDNRPDLCKLYEPQQDALCCEYVNTLKGIPIVVK